MLFRSAGDADNTFTLYEDDGVSLDYENGACATTPLTYSQKGNAARVTVGATDGSYKGQTLRRAYRLLLPGLAAGTKVKVDGRKRALTTDPATGLPCLDVPARDIRKPLTVEYTL